LLLTLLSRLLPQATTLRNEATFERFLTYAVSPEVGLALQDLTAELEAEKQAGGVRWDYSGGTTDELKRIRVVRLSLAASAAAVDHRRRDVSVVDHV